MNKRFISLLIGASLAFIIDAKDIEMKKFEPHEKDQLIMTSPRKDIIGTARGLIMYYPTCIQLIKK